ncbi:hypothetical protein [Desulfovibrio aminophilus]|uniref:hypothetical protein n=1 Tax=Desulfovibrio aminophilus TaxID=81425 RepID=UPI0033919C92
MEWRLKPEDTRLLLKSLFALVIIGIVAAVLVIPSRARLAELDTAIAGVQEKIARQEAFAPMFVELRLAAEREAGVSFGFPAHAPLDRQRLQDLPGLVQDKAQAAGLGVLEMTLDVNSVLLDRSRVMLQGVFSGQLAQFRLFYLELQSLPSLNRVERVEVRAVPEGLEFFVQMRFALT